MPSAMRPDWSSAKPLRVVVLRRTAREGTCGKSWDTSRIIAVGEAAPSPRSSGAFWRLSDMRIQPYVPEQLDAVVRLSLRAWTPVFESLQKVMDVDVYRALHP